MSVIEEKIVQHIRNLSPEHQRRVLDFVEQLEHPPALAIADQVAMGGGEEIRGHPLHLSREDVPNIPAEGLRMVALAPESKGSNQAGLGKQLVGVSDEFRQAVLS